MPTDWKMFPQANLPSARWCLMFMLIISNYSLGNQFIGIPRVPWLLFNNNPVRSLPLARMDRRTLLISIVGYSFYRIEQLSALLFESIGSVLRTHNLCLNTNLVRGLPLAGADRESTHVSRGSFVLYRRHRILGRLIGVKLSKGSSKSCILVYKAQAMHFGSCKRGPNRLVRIISMLGACSISSKIKH